MSKSMLRGVLVGMLLAVGFMLPIRSVQAEDQHWTYEGPEGPEHWGDLSPDYALCSAGQEQSPVDIPASAPVNPANLDYKYGSSAVNIFNNGHTIQVNYDQGSRLRLENSDYQLVQFHFHAHSEHTHNGASAPIEMHLVHQNAAGQLAVVGVWLEAGTENMAFKPIFDNLPTTVGDPQTIPNATINADALLPTERNYYRYNGSLTTPPCTEGVKWVMLDRRVGLSDAQINAYTSIFANDFRPTQPLNSRTFLTNAPSGVPAPLPSAGAPPSRTVYLAILGLWMLGGAFLIRRRMITN